MDDMVELLEDIQLALEEKDWGGALANLAALRTLIEKAQEANVNG